MAHSNRPTLPPLHTLGLPRGDIPPPRTHESYDPNDVNRLPLVPFRQPNYPQRHQPLISPFAASEELTSPTAYLRPRTNTPAPASASPSPLMPFPSARVRLSPTSLENADAVVLIAPPPAGNAPPPQPLLLVGPALQRLRQRERQVEKGTRVHPYRIIRGPSDQRPPY
ncbi:hypothetical protein J3R82DRAFT_7174 [Butyriboletus roseoflavus]|nr:hypothetical protein J3R82DRAFT_7174 [Butyriboletus roseoflavus]